MENQIKTVLKVSWLRYSIQLADVAPYLFSDVFAIRACWPYIVIRLEVSAESFLSPNSSQNKSFFILIALGKYFSCISFFFAKKTKAYFLNLFSYAFWKLYKRDFVFAQIDFPK